MTGRNVTVFLTCTVVYHIGKAARTTGEEVTISSVILTGERETGLLTLSIPQHVFRTSRITVTGNLAVSVVERALWVIAGLVTLSVAQVFSIACVELTLRRAVPAPTRIPSASSRGDLFPAVSVSEIVAIDTRGEVATHRTENLAALL